MIASTCFRYKFALLCIFSITQLNGSVTNWVGGSGDWSDATMWDAGVPMAGDSAIISQPGSVVTVDIDPAVARHIFIAFDAILDISSTAQLLVGSNTGNTNAMGIFNQGKVDNNGKLKIKGTSIGVLNQGIFINDGRLTLDDNSSHGFWDLISFTNTGTLEISKHSDHGLQVNGATTNSGTITSSSNILVIQKMTNSGTITIDANNITRDAFDVVDTLLNSGDIFIKNSSGNIISALSVGSPDSYLLNEANISIDSCELALEVGGLVENSANMSILNSKHHGILFIGQNPDTTGNFINHSTGSVLIHGIESGPGIAFESSSTSEPTKLINHGTIDIKDVAGTGIVMDEKSMMICTTTSHTLIENIEDALDINLAAKLDIHIGAEFEAK